MATSPSSPSFCSNDCCKKDRKECLFSCLRLLFWTIPILLLDALALAIMVLVLLPGFFRFGWYYWKVSHRESARYGNTSCRQTLDIYQPLKPQLHDSKGSNDSHERDDDPVSSSHRPSHLAATESQSSFSSEQMVEEEEGESSSAHSPLVRPLLRRTQQETSQQYGQQTLRPVVIFYTGGAWMIGYKMWGALLARALTATGCVVVVPDYRNYMPLFSDGLFSSCSSCCCRHGTTTTTTTSPCPMSDQVHDVRDSLEWIRTNVANYGGDPKQMLLVGQSAGGHLLSIVLLRQALASQKQQEHNSFDSAGKTQQHPCADADRNTGHPDNHPTEARTELDFSDEVLSFPATDFLGFISLSSPLDLSNMQKTFTRHGLDGTFQERIFGKWQDDYDPAKLVQELSRQRHDQKPLRGLLPPIRLYHGTNDRTVPHDSAVTFCRELSLGGADSVGFTSYTGWSHTHAILEGPMDADHRFHRHVFEAIMEWTADTSAKSSTERLLAWPQDDAISMQRLCPQFLFRLGKYFMPF